MGGSFGPYKVSPLEAAMTAGPSRPSIAAFKALEAKTPF